MAGFPAGLVDLIDTRVDASRIKTRSVGTFVGLDSGYAMVAFDGSALALPCKYRAGIPLSTNARVTVDMYGSDWVITGTFAASSPWPVNSYDFTALSNFTNTGPVVGSPPLEIQFDAPPSGAVYMTVGGQLTQSNAANLSILSYRVVQGTDYASGVEIQPFDARRGIIAGRAVSGGGPEASGTHRWPLAGLVPGSHYVARTGHWTSPAGTGTILARFLMAEPVM